MIEFTIFSAKNYRVYKAFNYFLFFLFAILLLGIVISSMSKFLIIYLYVFFLIAIWLISLLGFRSVGRISFSKKGISIDDKIYFKYPDIVSVKIINSIYNNEIESMGGFGGFLKYFDYLNKRKLKFYDVIIINSQQYFVKVNNRNKLDHFLGLGNFLLEKGVRVTIEMK